MAAMARGFALLIVLVAACTTGRGSLAIDLRSDLAPSVEIDRVRTVIEIGGVSRRFDTPLVPSDDLVRGERIALAEALEPGTAHVDVTLLAFDGSVIGQRVAVADVSGATVATLVFARDCAGIHCPDAAGSPLLTACIGGTCQDPRCTVESPSACTPECTRDADCPAPSSGCGLCVGGACLAVASCTDAGSAVLDGGLDAALDGGPCPAPCASCVGTRCTITGSVGMELVVCPPGFSCDISCGGGTLCAPGIQCAAGHDCTVHCGNGQCDGPIDCRAASTCTVICDGADSCSGGVDCPSSGACDVTCSGQSSCSGPIDCGSGPCSVMCPAQGSCGLVDCGSSCRCDVTCGDPTACGMAYCPAACPGTHGCVSVPACTSCP